jgi:hypothetical protein
VKLDFDIASVRLTEFGVGRDDSNGRTYVAVPVDASVQIAIREMAQATWRAMERDSSRPAQYEPSEKHASMEYLYLPLRDDLASSVRDLHVAANLDIDSSALTDPSEVFCYFARLTDGANRRLTAVRRATQFKGVLKSKGRLVRMLDDTLQIIEDTVFKLDGDFDLLVDSANVLILRPSGFEFTGNLKEAILDAVPENVAAVRKDLSFVEFDGIEEYASAHPRAARYLASIRGQELRRIDKAALKRYCKRMGVAVQELNGQFTVTPGYEMDFLEVLDRRRYEVELVKGRPERFRAASRNKLDA